MIKLCGLGFTLDWLYRGVEGGVSVEWEGYLREKSRASRAVFPAKVRLARESIS